MSTPYSNLEVHDDALPQSRIPESEQKILPDATHEQYHENQPASTASRGSSLKRWVLPAIIATLVAALIGVSGGLGKSLSDCQQRSSSSQDISSAAVSAMTTTSTSTPTLTVTETNSARCFETDVASGQVINYVPNGTETVKSLAVNFADLNGRTLISKFFNDEFKVSASYDLGGDNITDLFGIVAYTLADCINACSASYNIDKDSCHSVTLNVAMAQAVEDHGGTCFLKRGTVTVVDASTARPSDDCISAQMVW